MLSKIEKRQMPQLSNLYVESKQTNKKQLIDTENGL